MNLRLALVLLIAIALQACGGTKKEIIGKWRVEGGASETTWEFRGNGSVTGGDRPGRYTLGDGNRLKIETGAATFVHQVEIKGDHMTWTHANGTKTELLRVK
ncbi:MAG: hypothetical protein M3032_08730 [Verrucomicrobiota bacterium]|nr:hypothetical protein [Verrucomicrobiota bacterium]